MSDVTRDVENVVRELETLTVTGIRARFQREGIKGKPSRSWCCPVANYVIKRVPDSSRYCLRVTGVHIGMTFVLPTGGDDAFLKEWWRNNAASLCEFVRRFDAGDFPELVAEDL